MAKLLVLAGPPASGKSTFAREFVKGKTDWVIVNRDSLRIGRGDYWIESQEDYITNLEEHAIREAMKMGLNVMIDATNLSGKANKKWVAYANEFHYELERKEFYVPFKVALERDKERAKNGADHSVGKKVLESFYKRYYPEEYMKEMRMVDDRIIKDPDLSLPSCVICDLDGTISIRRKARSAFEYDKIGDDLFDPRMKRLLNLFIEMDIPIIFFSGRENVNDCYEDSLNWLKKNLVYEKAKGLDGHKYPTFDLHMRKYNDHRPDDVVKSEMYDEYVKDQYDVLCIFDDRDKVVKMWREKGLLCNQVYYGDF